MCEKISGVLKEELPHRIPVLNYSFLIGSGLVEDSGLLSQYGMLWNDDVKGEW